MKKYRPKDKDRPTIQTIDVGGSSGSGGGGGGEVEVKSWQFSLVDKTIYASLAKVGTRVIGVVNGFDVVVMDNSHNYGFAPKDIALEIIEAMNGRGNLIGTVISINVSSNPSDTDVWVRIVLR